jgi:membrane-associated protein
MNNLIHILIDPQTLIETLGVIGVIAIVFLETGAFFGFFFPGDSLLFTAGYLASQGYISLALLLIGAFVAAVIGDNVGYAFGKRIGQSLFKKEDSLIFNKKHVVRAQLFYEKYGKKTIVMARFIPVVRTFAPIVAGIGNMNYRTFVYYNALGGFLWTWAMLWLGFGFGSLIPNPDRYVIPAIVIIILISAAPAVKEVLMRKKE